MTREKLNILLVLPSYAVHWGGPAHVVRDICFALSSHFKFTLLTTSNRPEDEILPIPDEVEYVSFNTQKPLSNLWKSFSTEIDEWLEQNIRRFHLVHIHEMWHYSQFAATRKALKYGIPYLVSPHGELDKWRISHKSLRKKIFGAIFQKKMLLNASLVHALTDHEKLSIQQFSGNKANISVIPNGLKAVRFLNGVDRSHGKKYILFLGRIQKVKGCLELLEGYAQWQGKEEYDLVFVGPFEEKHYMEALQGRVAFHQLSGRVHFKGLASGQVKQAYLHHASLFVLPSFSEGFPVSVLEAMEAGCPLIISDNTGINELMHENNAAIICKAEPASVLQALNTFRDMTQDSIEAMVSNATNVFRAHFSLEKVMQSYETVYRALIKKSKGVKHAGDN